MVVAVGFGRAVVFGAGVGVGGLAAAGGGLEGRIVTGGGVGDVLVTAGSTAGRIVIGGDAIGSGAAVLDVTAVAGEGGGAGGAAGAVGTSGTAGAALAGAGASVAAVGDTAGGVTGCPPLVASQMPIPPPTTARAPSPSQSPFLERRANDGTTPSSSSEARRGRVFGIAGATRRVVGDCAGVGTETATGTGMGRVAAPTGGAPSTITDSLGSTDTVALGGECEPFVDC
jgi:hypothetical protein